MTEPLRAISADDSALCLLKAVQLGHVEVALQLLQSGIQLSRRLEKEDLEADAPSEVESVWEFHRGVWRWRSWEHDLVSKRGDQAARMVRKKNQLIQRWMQHVSVFLNHHSWCVCV